MGYSIVDRANESSVIKPSYQARVREQWVTLVLRWTAISTASSVFKSWYTLRVIFAQLPSNNRGRKASIIKTSHITPISLGRISVGCGTYRDATFVKPRNERSRLIADIRELLVKKKKKKKKESYYSLPPLRKKQLVSYRLFTWDF